MSRSFRPFFLILAATSAATGVVRATGAEDDVVALVKSVRSAIGGEAKVASVQGLSIVADMRRILPSQDGQPGPEMSGEVRIDVGQPGQYFFVDAFSPMAGMPPIEVGSGLDAGEPWTATLKTPGPHVMIRAGGSGDPAALKTRLDRESSRVALAFLAGARPGFTFKDAGEAESPDGKARVLDVAGPSGFATRMLVDAKSSRPIMLLYKEMPRRVMMQRGAPGGDARPNGDNPPPTPTPGALADARVFLSEFKKVDGIEFPHRVLIEVDGGQTEEWTVREIKVNPKFSDGHFKKRG